MNIEFKIAAAKAAYENAEKAVSSGVSNGATQYKAAAKYYRELATALPAKKDEYLKMAEECEAKANGTFSSTPNKAASNKRLESNAKSNANSKNNNASNQLNPLKNNQPPQQRELKTVESDEQVTVEDALKKLNDLVGLASVKKKVVEWVALVKSFKEREANGLPVPEGFS